MPVAVSDNTGTILINDGNSVIHPKKEKVIVTAAGNNVRIGWDRVHYVTYPYTDFTAPTGADAPTVAAAITAFLNTE